MHATHALLPALSALVNTLGQLCGVGGRPFLQVLFQAVFTNSLRTSAQVIATALLVNTIAFSLGVPGYNALGLYDARLVLDLATVSVPAAILGASAGAFVPDRTLRLAYSALAACTAAALVARLRRLAPAVDDKRPAPAERSSLIGAPHESFSREGNFLSNDDVEHLNMLDDSDTDDDIEVSPMYRALPSRVLSVCSLPSLSNVAQALLNPSTAACKNMSAPLSHMLRVSRDSIHTLSTRAQSFITMSASTTASSLPTTRSYGAISGAQQWHLLDRALATYERPRLTSTCKFVLGAGGLLCGALGVGTAESVLIVLVGLCEHVPLACAATAAISVAFYAQMTASVMDGVASAADLSTPRIAESVPWSVVAGLLPGVVVGALVGPRLHAFVPERRMLQVAAATLLCVSAAVGIVGYTALVS